MGEERANTLLPLRVYYRKMPRQIESNFPEELVLEILKYLPVESLIRCMCVSKSWYSFITNPSFVSTHIRCQSDRRIKDSISTIYQVDSQFFLHKLPEPLDHWTEVDSPMANLSIVVGFCHGVICLLDHFAGAYGSLILWNPSIRKAVTLQFNEPSLNIQGLRIQGGVRPNFCFGFGFDPVSNDYKVVRLVYKCSEMSNISYVYSDVCSLNKDGWRSDVTLVQGHNFRLQCRGVYLNGVIHWMCMKIQEGAVIAKTILTFDLASEKLGYICLPMNVDVRSITGLMSITTVEDKLAVSCLDSGGNIWFMEEYGKSKSWRRLIDFYVGDTLGLIQGAIITGDGKTVVTTSAGNWISWDCTNSKIENLALPLLEPDYINAYVPSLVLLRCKNTKLHCKEIVPKKRETRTMSPRDIMNRYFLAMLRGAGYIM